MIGELNAQYGSYWIKNDILKKNRKLKSNENIPVGWKRGRNMKYSK